MAPTAGIGFAVLIVLALAYAEALAAPIYDMRDMLHQRHPLATQQAPSPTQPAAPAVAPRPADEKPMIPFAGVTRLYDMRDMLRQRHPLAPQAPARVETVPAPAQQPQLTPPRPIETMPPAAGVTRLYDVSLFLFQPHPFYPLAPLQKRPPAAADRPVTPRQAAPAAPSDEAFDEAFESEEDDLDPGDPFEPVNRFFFRANQLFLDYMLGPVTTAYQTVMPDFLEEAVGNALDNVSAPIILANDILQFEPVRAWETTARFLVNSTAGVGGFFDVATKIGIEGHEEDFGQTLAVWGVGEGPYLVLPLLGPSNPRDAFGKHLVDAFFDPFGVWLSDEDLTTLRYGISALKAVDRYGRVKDDLEKVRKTSIDYYGALRSLYRQRRATEIRNDSGIRVPDLDFDVDYDAEE
jgi:phospholipid-binding lipoprotein MlaA